MLLLLGVLTIIGFAGEIRLSHGVVTGTTSSSDEVRVFKGIPYAAPPVGELRWKPPQPVAPWKGAREAKEFSAVCMQTPYPAGSLYRTELPKVSEDCLYLNVWTTAKSAREKRPVMVWIHGGALTRGSGSTPTYDGEQLAKKGVVLVTINYRLGGFGFFAHPELTAESKHKASGNQGLLDQVAALEWVKANIAAFGGDPGNVTVFGESAGSWSVNFLMATPLAKGLIHRVIGESGGTFNAMQNLAEAERAGEKMGPLKDQQNKTAEEIQKSGPELTRGIVDGRLLKQDVRNIFEAGKQNDVPLVAGFNADEGTAFMAGLTPEAAAGRYESQPRSEYGELASEYLKAYPASTPEEKRKALLATFRDSAFGWQMRTWVRFQTRTGKSPAYLYYFSRVPPGPTSGRFGSFHAAEIAYVFGNLRPPRPWEEADRKLSAAMMDYWVNFAKTGDPNGRTLVAWPKYVTSAEEALELGDSILVRKNLHKEQLDFFDRVDTARRARSSSSGGR